jgi:hypothetical protein
LGGGRRSPLVIRPVDAACKSASPLSLNRGYQIASVRCRCNLAVREHSREGPASLRVIRCLPVTWQCGALRGRASDKPRGRATRQQSAQADLRATKLLFEILGKVDPRAVAGARRPTASSLADEAIEQVREKLARLARDHSASSDDAEPPKGTE